MADIFYVGAWGGHASGLTPSQTSSITRSLTPAPKTPSRIKQLSHSISTPHLAANASASRESEMMNTIPDPRSPSPATPISKQVSTDSLRHPDLSAEVATLSTKLVNAINHQTNLDDTLQETRHDLEAANEKIARLEAEAKEHSDLVKQGFWVKREEYDALQREALEDQKQRKTMEKEKKRMESELENLTTALFEEANTMVAAARKETEASEKRNEQLKNQLHDSEILLRSHQDQLYDLKSVMEKMSSERDENESNSYSMTAPSTPGVTAQDKVARMLDNANGSPITPGVEEAAPDQPLRFSHLIHPVLRTDLNAYKEFQDLLRQGRVFSNPPSRVSSGNYGKLNVLGLGGLDPSNASNSNGSTTSLPLTNSPTTPSSATATSPRTPGNLPPLKESLFFKRALTEDIEPTLRLDQAPGVSWMGRRTVINSITTGSLVVEPHPPIKKYRGPVYACSLCGENRVAEQYNRSYRFKTSEAEDAQRFPLCDWCLGRVRSTCDYVGFLRMVQAGHWRADSEEEMKAAWEEAVRFRERMFWARIGGGVIPALSYKESLKSPTKKALDRASEESAVISNANGVDGNANGQKQDDPFDGTSGSPTTIFEVKDVSAHAATPEQAKAEPTASQEEQELVSKQILEESKRMSEMVIKDITPPQDKQSTPEMPRENSESDAARLSASMPGAFN